MTAALPTPNNIDQEAKVHSFNASLPPDGIAYLADGRPLNPSSFQAWKGLKLADRIQRNATHLEQSVKPWNDLLDNPIPISQLYKYYFVFMHIPKAGGTTLQHVIAKNYLPNQFVHANSNQIHKNPACLYHVKRKEVRPIVMGHFDRSCILYHLLCDRPIIHFTMLRQPIQRVLSHYRYLQGNVVHEKHQDVKQMSLEDYAASALKEIQNKQTLRLLGDPSRAAQQQSLNDPEPLFKAAKQVLERQFTFFGITEQYTRLLLMAQKLLKWENIVYRRKNSSSGLVTSELVTSELGTKDLDPNESGPSNGTIEQSEADQQGMKIIHERNQLDLQLYDFACQLFESRYSELAIPPEAEETFEHINQRYQIMLNELNTMSV